MNKKVSILTNNPDCERLVQYYAKIENYLKFNGWDICTDFNANKFIIVGCGFHDQMLYKVINCLNTMKKNKVEVKDIILMGCLPRTHEKDIRELYPGIIINYNCEDLLDKNINSIFPFASTREANTFNASINDIDNCFYIKISEGCLQTCTFCVIKKAKGKIKSIPYENIKEQFTEAKRLGYERVFLCGEDTFAYGHDSGVSFSELIYNLIKINPRIKFYFGSLHSRWLPKYKNDLISWCESKNVETLHIGLQHVNPEILKKMGRPDNHSEIYNIIKSMKIKFNNIYLIADIIVGFPGETIEQFNELIDFFKKDECFDRVHHFGYSDVKGAEAATFEDKVSSADIAVRWSQLNKILGKRSGYEKTSDNKTVVIEDYKFCKDIDRFVNFSRQVIK